MARSPSTSSGRRRRGCDTRPSRRSAPRMRSSTGCRSSRAGGHPSSSRIRTCGSACVLHARPRRLRIDLSGAPLHRRGYRQSAVEAPLKENLAAALLLRSGWPEIAAAGGAFADPMCGSGTFVIEAALIAGQHAPGLFRRRFGFERWLRTRRGGLDRRARRGTGAVDARRTGARPVQRQRREPGCRAGDAREREPRRDRRVRDGSSAARSRISSPASSRSGLVFVNPPYGGKTRRGRRPRAALSLAGQCAACAVSRAGKPASSRAIRRSVASSGCARTARTRSSTARSSAGCCGSSSMKPPVSPTASRCVPSAAAPRVRARVPTMFANRLRKNLKSLQAWARREDVSCFRVYDADMPEYAFAIDVYGNGERHACVQEYEAPATVDAQAARARRDEALSVLEEVLALPHERVHLQDATPPARGGAVRSAGRDRTVSRSARGREPLPRQFQRLPRYRAVSRSSPDACADRRQGSRAAVPEPVCLHGHGHGLRGASRRRVNDDDRHVAHVSRLGAAQPRAQRAGGAALTNSCRQTVCNGWPSSAARCRATS